VFRRSSAVEQLTVNQLVVGSIPTAGAKNPAKTKIQRPALSRLLSILELVTELVTSFCRPCETGRFWRISMRLN